MKNPEQRVYLYQTDDNWVWEKCVQLIIDRLLEAREWREKKHLEIYFSLDDIMWLGWYAHFLQEDAANEMHDCQIENRLFRSKQQLLSCTEYDDSIEDYLKGIWVFENYIYIWEDDTLKLKSADRKKNTISTLPVTGAKDFSIFTELLPFYKFVTTSNLVLRVWYWWVRLPDNFMYRLLQNKLISKKWYIKISDNVYVNKEAWHIVWEKRDKIVKKYDWKRKTRQYAIIENLMIYRSAGSKYAGDFLIECTKKERKSERDDIIKIFAEISDDEVVTSRGWMLRFLDSPIIIKITEKPR